MRKPALCCLAIILVSMQAVHASMLFTISQVGSDVVVNGSGSLNLGALNFATNGSANAYIVPQNEVLFSGPTGTTGYSAYQGGGLTGPTSFGNGGFTAASSGTGSLVGIGGALFVPQGYISGSALTNSATFGKATFTSLGFTPGTYTYTWGTGMNADSLTITSTVPEPSAWALLGVGALSLGLLFRHQIAVRACHLAPG